MKKSLLTIFVIFLACLTLKTFALANPWIDCEDDISCAAKKAGFNFPLRVRNYSVRAMKDMIELEFPLGWVFKRMVTVRKASTCERGYDENGICDVSGVYDVYSTNKTIRLKNGVVFSVRGKKNKFYVANFAAESGYYSFYSPKGMYLRDLNYFYKILEEAEAARIDYDKKMLTIEELMDLRRVDEVVEPIFTQDCFPRTLAKKGVTFDCFERANLGEDSVCSASEIRMIKEYYKKGQDKDPLNDGGGRFCADEQNIE